MGKQFTTLDIRRAEGTCWISFNRPKVMNAFDRTQWLELNEALADAEEDETIRCVVLRGAGGNFSSGYDLPAALDELDGVPADGVRAHIRPGNQACWRVWHFKKPVIAAIEGYCLGGAFELAMACDFVLAEENARLGEPECRVAASPPFLISPWVMGMRHAKEVLLTGDVLSAARAERIGLINEVCEQGQIELRVKQWARKLSGFSSEIWYANKLAINRSYEIMGFNAAIGSGEDAFVALSFIPGAFKTELFERVQREGFSAAIKWAQSRYE
jgi:enoyl-CoA hydratase